MSRELFAREALAQIPKILTLQDRNAHSPTYGCFDRNFWHYKIIDFPSGMSQEFVWPLALAWDTELEGNAFYRQDALREWAEAGMVLPLTLVSSGEHWAVAAGLAGALAEPQVMLTVPIRLPGLL